MTRPMMAVLVVAGLIATPDAARAQTDCKICADQQKACMKNYGGPTCKTEYQMCIKSCKK
jgi:hypothetical protein